MGAAPRHSTRALMLSTTGWLDAVEQGPHRKGSRVIDPLASLRTGKRIDHHVCGADETCLHRRRGLDGEEFMHQGLINAAAKLGEDFRQDEMPLESIDMDVGNPAYIHHGQIGPQPAANLLIRTLPFVFQSLQRQQHPCRAGCPPPRGRGGKTPGYPVVHRCTNAAHGNVPAHWRNGWVSGTKSATRITARGLSTNCVDVRLYRTKWPAPPRQCRGAVNDYPCPPPALHRLDRAQRHSYLSPTRPRRAAAAIGATAHPVDHLRCWCLRVPPGIIAPASTDVWQAHESVDARGGGRCASP